jgi:CheY-like chemotaxis protein
MLETILVVDDDPGIRDVTRLVLGREGYSVLVATDGNSAKQLMTAQENAQNVCTVLCDLEMPNGSGKEFIAYLRMNHPTIPIIVLSGAPDVQFLEGILQQGVSDWIRKPVTREILLQKVRTGANLFALRKQQGA